MESFLRTVGDKALGLAKKQGIEAEVFLLHDRELSIEVINEQVETLKEAEEVGMGLRVINRGRLGFAYTSDLSDDAIKETADIAVKISQYTDVDEHHVLPGGKLKYQDMELFDADIVRTSVENKIDLARQVEQAAKVSDPRITIIERSGYEENEFSCLIMNTRGVYAFAQSNLSGLYISLVAEENADAQTGFSAMIKKKIADLQPEFVGREAAQKAVRNLHSRTIRSARMPCIMEPYIVTKFLSIVAAIVNAESVQKGKSMFAGKEGQAVASGAFTLVDDATYQNGISSFPFDAEGIPTRKNIIVENGVLCNFLYDTYTANKAGKKSTGNARRGSFRTLPSVGTTNFMLLPGAKKPEELIGDIEEGFYITEVMGMHTANPISGDFSVGASGLMIENGSLTYPVRGVTIAGNLADFLKNIDAVGNDLRFFGAKAAPTVRLESLSISGK